MKTFWSIFRIAVIAVISLYLIEKLSGVAEGEWAIIQHPVLILVWLGIALFMTAIEVSIASLRRLLFHTLSDEAKAKYLAAEEIRNEKFTGRFKKLYHRLVDSKPVEKEGEILLDHDYDGIKELDNNLPPWWLYGFYISILFAIIYMVRFHVFDGKQQDEEYQMEMAKAALEIEEYKKNAKDLVDASTVVVLTDPADLNTGKSVFETTCAACHRADGGGGIGPNLTDDYWIMGGDIRDIFTVISEGGRPGKGMIAWKNDLSPLQIAQTASYITTLYGTNPADAKDPEGELYVKDGDSGEQATDTETIDSAESESVSEVEQ